MKEVRSAIIGFGGIARAHAAGYRILARDGVPVRLVAVCDIDPQRLRGELKINVDTGKGELPADCQIFTSVDEMLDGADFDMVDICLPTYLHKEYAIKMLKAGKHVLSEKPMALSYADCCEMIEAAKASDRRLMIGQCLRFNTNYLFIKECVEDGRYGKLLHMEMERRSLLPDWGFENWFQDAARSGGCALDMHIHDVDMARFLLGEPTAVSAIALEGTTPYQYVNTRLFYEGGPTVIIDGSWYESAGTPFRAACRARFETATVVLENNAVTVYPDVKKAEPITIDHTMKHHMAEEIKFLVSSILDPTVENKKNPPESAAKTVRVVEMIKKSADEGGITITL